jgi:5-methylcytosine-specific restriction endonuclease McrA
MPTVAAAVKTCPRCGEEKPLEAFARNRSKASGRDSYCTPCMVEKNREYKRRNPDQRRETSRRAVAAWKERNRDHYNESQRRWQEANRDKVRAANRRSYKRHAKSRSMVANARRRARKAAAAGAATATQIAARVAYYGARCWICRAPCKAIDHVKPLAAGGSNWPANLRPICGACNSAKGDRWPLSSLTCESAHRGGLSATARVNGTL